MHNMFHLKALFETVQKCWPITVSALDSDQVVGRFKLWLRSLCQLCSWLGKTLYSHIDSIQECNMGASTFRAGVTLSIVGEVLLHNSKHAVHPILAFRWFSHT